jgi:uncharacterized membrane protein
MKFIGSANTICVTLYILNLIVLIFLAIKYSSIRKNTWFLFLVILECIVFTALFNNFIREININLYHLTHKYQYIAIGIIAILLCLYQINKRKKKI